MPTIYTEKKEILDFSFGSKGELSIACQTVVLKDGIDFSYGEKVRRAFIPGQFQEVEDWMSGSEGGESRLQALQAMWTQQVIEDYQSLLEQE